jgi:Protein of unknown function (DUF3168)
MPAGAALAPIYAALVALLEADAALTALLASRPMSYGGGPAIYDEGAVPQTAAMPYLTIGAGTQIGFHSMGPAYGWNCTLQIKASGQGTEAEGLAIMSAVLAVLPPGRLLDVPPFASAWCDAITLQPTIITLLAGVTTRGWPALFRVYVHD